MNPERDARFVRLFRRPDPERLAWEQPLRAQLVRRLLFVAAFAETLFLALGFGGMVRCAFFPWIGFEALALLLLAGWLVHRGNVSSAATSLVISLSHVGAFVMAAYRPGSPAAVLLLPTIIIGGLVVGGYFLAGWTMICVLLLFWVSAPHFAFSAVQLLWTGVYALTAYLVWLFSSHLERLIAASRRADEYRQQAVVEERTRLAREVHDTIAQGLTGIVVQINAAEQITAQNDAVVWQHLTKARDLARQSLEEARRSILALRRPPLDLLRAIEASARPLIVDDSVQLETTSTGTPRELPTELGDEIARIGQEAVTNALRHAGSSHIRVVLEYRPHEIVLCVSDDGRGFANGTRGHGIRGMEERARRWGGELQIARSESGGTKVTASVPWPALDLQKA